MNEFVITYLFIIALGAALEALVVAVIMLIFRL